MVKKKREGKAAVVGDEDDDDDVKEVKRGKGKPSVPDYNYAEDLAVARAAQVIGKKPDQAAGTELRSRFKEVYPLKLKETAAEVGWTSVVWNDGGERREWTIQDACNLRPTITNMWLRYTENFRKPAKRHLR